MVEDPFLYCLTLFTFAVIFGLCYIRYAYTFFERNAIPAASVPTFPWGNVGDVVLGDTAMFVLIWKIYNRFKRRKHQLGGFYVFLRPVVMLVDSEIILKNKKHFNDDDECDLSNLSQDNYEIIDNMLQRCLNYLENIITDVPAGETDFTSIVSKWAVNLSVRNIFGKVDQLNEDFLSMVEVLLGKNKQSHIQTSIAIYRQRLKSRPFKTEVMNIVDSTTSDRKKNDKKGADIMQIMIQSDLTLEQQVNFIYQLHEKLQSASDLILLCLLELSNNEEIQDDLRGEILRFRRQDARITLKGLDQLSYLESVICETLRKFPVEPFIWKTCKSEYTSDTLNIKANTSVFVSTFGIHHDPDNYTNAEMFDPDRFSEENIKFIEPYKYLPFGSNSKDSFGCLYLRLVMKLALVELLTRFKFSLGRKSRKLKFDESSFRIKPKDAIWFNVEKI